jgi:hypothetical protein
MDSQIYSKNLDLVLQVYKWVIAESNSELRNYDEHGQCTEIAPKKFGAERNMIPNDVFIRLMRKQGQSLTTV